MSQRRSASPSPIRGDERPRSINLELERLNTYQPDLNFNNHVHVTPPTPSGVSVADTEGSAGRPSTEGSCESESSTRSLIRKDPPVRHNTVLSTSDAGSSNGSSSRRTTADLAQVPHISALPTGDEAVERATTGSGDAAKAWSDCARAMMEYDEANVRRWKEEIDTLLVFAGLFSAVVTAFLVESCKSLHPEPAERVIALLEVIASEMRNSTAESPVPSRPEVDTRFVSADQAPLVNALWFTSLILSLGVAFVGLLVKQWFGEYTAGLMTVSRSRVSRKHARTRQYRHNAMRKWRVRTIMIYLPVILQFALIFFLVGLCELLWAFNLQVAKVALAFVAAIAAFSIITSVLPTFFDDCSYRSPHAFVPYFVWKILVALFRSTLLFVHGVLSWRKPSPSDSPFVGMKRPSTPSTVDDKKTPSQPKPSLLALLKSAGEKRTHWSWKDREESALSVLCQDSYDAAMIDELDRLKIDLVVLRDVVQPCLPTLPLEGAFCCVRNILTRRADAHTGDLPEWKHVLLDRETLLVLLDIVLALLQREELIAPSLHQQDKEASEGKKAIVRKQKPLEMQRKALAMLQRLAFSHYYALLKGEYSPMVAILMSYRRHLDLQEESSSSRQLVYIMLSGLCTELRSDAVEVQDISEVIAYGSSEVFKKDFPDDDRAPLCVATLAVAIMRAAVARGPPSTDLLPLSQLDILLDQAREIVQEKLKHVMASLPVRNPLDLRVAILEFLAAVESLLELQPNIHLDFEDTLSPWSDFKRYVEVFCPRYPSGAASSDGAQERSAHDIFENIGKLLRGEVTAAARGGRPPVIRKTSDSLPKPLLRSADSMNDPSPPTSPTDGPAATISGRFLLLPRFFHRKMHKRPSYYTE